MLHTAFLLQEVEQGSTVYVQPEYQIIQGISSCWGGPPGSLLTWGTDGLREEEISRKSSAQFQQRLHCQRDVPEENMVWPVSQQASHELIGKSWGGWVTSSLDDPLKNQPRRARAFSLVQHGAQYGFIMALLWNTFGSTQTHHKGQKTRPKDTQTWCLAEGERIEDMATSQLCAPKPSSPAAQTIRRMKGTHTVTWTCEHIWATGETCTTGGHSNSDRNLAMWVKTVNGI